jgi:hypothetical protein
LSINGQVFATAIHIFPEMASNSNVLSTSTKFVDFHEHHQKTSHHKEFEHNTMTHVMSESQGMSNCQCIDCDCVQNVAGQINNALIQDSELFSYLPVLTTILIKTAPIFISQPHTNLFRPPIIA